MQTVATPIINCHNENLDASYKCYNGIHLVYVGLEDQVRRLILPDEESANKLVKSLSAYKRLRVKI